MSPKKRKSASAVTSQGLDALALGADVAARKLFLFGEVDDEVAQRFIVALQLIDATSGPIYIDMNSAGGQEAAGFAIYDALRLTNNWVTITGYGSVASISAMIFQAANTRVLTPNSRMMIHNGSVDVPPMLTQDELINMGKECEITNHRYARILADRSGQELETVKDMCRRETFVSAGEAVALGFADSVLKHRKKSK